MAGIEGEVVNLGTGVEIPIGELAERILGLVGRDLPIISATDRLRPPSSELQRLVCDSSKAHALLGWRHRVGLDEGLRRTVDWIEGSMAVYKPSKYNL